VSGHHEERVHRLALDAMRLLSCRHRWLQQPGARLGENGTDAQRFATVVRQRGEALSLPLAAAAHTHASMTTGTNSGAHANATAHSTAQARRSWR